MRNLIGLLFYCSTIFSFNCCTFDSLSSEEGEKQILQSLIKRYPEDEFKIINVSSANAPGDKITKFTSKVSSKKYERKDLWLQLERCGDSIIITEDTYAILLLSEVYLDRIKTSLKQRDNIFYNVVLEDLNDERPYLRNKSEAEQYFKLNESIQWVNLIGIYTASYDDKDALVATVTSLAYEFEEIYPGSHSFEVYFYPLELKENNLQFLSDEDMMDKAPEKDKYFAYWLFPWRKSQLEEDSNLDDFIKSRKEVKNWRRGEYNK